MRTCRDCKSQPSEDGYNRCFECLPSTHKGVCPECGGRYVKRAGASGPLPKRCDPCRRRRKYEQTKASQQRALRNPDTLAKELQRRREQMRRWRAENPDRARANAREAKRRLSTDPVWRAKTQANMRRARLARIYGLSEDQYDQIVSRQGGGCAICGAGVNADGRRLAVDHDHACCPGKRSCGACIRGILCTSCNHGLGRFRDDPALLRRAVDYLERISR